MHKRSRQFAAGLVLAGVACGGLTRISLAAEADEAHAVKTLWVLPKVVGATGLGVVKGKVAYETTDWVVEVVEGETGKAVWSVKPKPGESIRSPQMAVGGEGVYTFHLPVGMLRSEQFGMLTARHWQDGSVQWEKERAPILHLQVTPAGLLAQEGGTEATTAVVYDPQTGNRKWRAERQMRAQNFAWHDGKLLFTAFGPEIGALDAQRGTKLWEGKEPGIVPTPQSWLEAQRSGMGASIGTMTGLPPVARSDTSGSPLAVEGDVVYLASVGDRPESRGYLIVGDKEAGKRVVTAYDLKADKSLWSTAVTLPKEVHSELYEARVNPEFAPVVAGDCVIVQGYIWVAALERKSGKVRWVDTLMPPLERKGVGNWITRPEVPPTEKVAYDRVGKVAYCGAGGVVVFGHLDGVVGIDLVSGKRLWEYKTGLPVADLAVEGPRMYVTTTATVGTDMRMEAVAGLPVGLMGLDLGK